MPTQEKDLLKPTPTTNDAITPAALAPTQPLKLPQSEPAEQQSSSFLSYLETLSGNTQSSKEQKDTSLKGLMSSYLTSETEGSLTNQAYGTNGGVDQLKGELNDLNAQLTGEQHSLRRQIEDIDKNAEGLTRGAVQSLKSTAERESLRKQADIAVVQMAKQGQYDSAKQIADRAISAYLEKQKQRNDMLQFIYKENKEQFNKDEQREFETRQKEREHELDNKEYRMRAEFDAKIKQSDPLYLAQLENARATLLKTRADVAAATASAKVTPLKLARQQGSINEVTDILSSPVLGTAVGPNIFARGAITGLTGSKANFIASVEQLRSQLSINSLTEAKANGATFGALSEGEMRVLSSAATKLERWAKKNSSDQVVAYSVDEASFRAELDKINYYAKLDYLLKGGDAASVGVQVMPDNTMWTQNSDGTFVQLITE